MTLTTETQIETGNAHRYLDELCRQLDARSHAKPELGARVRWTDAEASIDFGWGRCAIRARETSLHVRGEATDPDALRQIRELMTRHHGGQAMPAQRSRQDLEPRASKHDPSRIQA